MNKPIELVLYWHPFEGAYYDPGSGYVYEDGTQIVDMIESDDWEIVFGGDYFKVCECGSAIFYHWEKEFESGVCFSCARRKEKYVVEPDIDLLGKVLDDAYYCIIYVPVTGGSIKIATGMIDCTAKHITELLNKEVE